MIDFEQTLLQEVAALPKSRYADVLAFVRYLKLSIPSEELQLAQRLDDVLEAIRTRPETQNITPDDIDAEMNIINGDIEFTILNQHYYDKDELKGIQSELRNINWDEFQNFHLWRGYEFIDFIDIQTNETYFLFGDKNSDIFNQINSPQNINNINNFAKRINGEYGK